MTNSTQSLKYLKTTGSSRFVAGESTQSIFDAEDQKCTLFELKT